MIFIRRRSFEKIILPIKSKQETVDEMQRNKDGRKGPLYETLFFFFP